MIIKMIVIILFFFIESFLLHKIQSCNYKIKYNAKYFPFFLNFIGKC